MQKKREICIKMQQIELVACFVELYGVPSWSIGMHSGSIGMHWKVLGWGVWRIESRKSVSLISWYLCLPIFSCVQKDASQLMNPACSMQTSKNTCLHQLPTAPHCRRCWLLWPLLGSRRGSRRGWLKSEASLWRRKTLWSLRQHSGWILSLQLFRRQRPASPELTN